MSENRFAEEIIRLVDLEVEDASPRLLAGIRAQVAAAMEAAAPIQSATPDAPPYPFYSENMVSQEVVDRFTQERAERDATSDVALAEACALQGRELEWPEQYRICTAFLAAVQQTPSAYSDEEPFETRRHDAARDQAAYEALPHIPYAHRRMFRDGWDAAASAFASALDPHVLALALRRAREGKPLTIAHQERVCQALLDLSRWLRR